MDQQFVVSSSPFIRSKNDLNKLLWYTALVLLFPIVYGIIIFGFKAFVMVIVTCTSCAVFESLYNLYETGKFKLYNVSFMVTGIILALSFPVKVPLYVLVLSSFFAIVIVKMVFGGIGRNYFNPACTARCLAGMLIPGLTSELYTTTIAGEEYVSLSAGGTNILQNMMSGNAVGNIGTTCIVVLIVSFVCLAYLKIIEIKLPILAVISFIAVSLFFHNIEITAMNLCSGSFIFVSIFVITDPNTSPNTFFGKILYAVGFGAISALVWDLKFLGENTAFVVALFVNLFTPFMDKYLIARPTTLGGFRNAYKN